MPMVKNPHISYMLGPCSSNVAGKHINEPSQEDHSYMSSIPNALPIFLFAILYSLNTSQSRSKTFKSFLKKIRAAVIIKIQHTIPDLITMKGGKQFIFPTHNVHMLKALNHFISFCLQENRLL